MRRGIMRPRSTILYGNDSTVNTNTLSNTVPITRPSGLANGSLVVVQHATTAVNTMAAPDGTWGGGHAGGYAVWWKWITNLAGEPASWTFSGGGLVTNHISAHRFEGTNPTTPVIDPQRVTAAGIPNSPASTATQDGQLVISGFQSVNTSSATSAPPAGMTKIFENNSNATRALASLLIPRGAYDPAAWGMASNNHGSFTLILNPVIT